MMPQVLAIIINGRPGFNSLKDSNEYNMFVLTWSLNPLKRLTLLLWEHLTGVLRLWSASVCLMFFFSFCRVLNSKLPYDVTPEQAMAHEEVRTRLEASIKNMKTITDKFLSAIIVSVDKIPYVARSQSRCLHGRVVYFLCLNSSVSLCLSDTGCVSSPRCWRTPCTRSSQTLPKMSCSRFVSLIFAPQFLW